MRHLLAMMVEQELDADWCPTGTLSVVRVLTALASEKHVLRLHGSIWISRSATKQSKLFHFNNNIWKHLIPTVVWENCSNLHFQGHFSTHDIHYYNHWRSGRFKRLSNLLEFTANIRGRVDPIPVLLDHTSSALFCLPSAISS